MRQRIKIFTFTILIFLTTFIIVIISLYNSSWAKQKAEGSLGTAQAFDKLNSENNYTFIGTYTPDFCELSLDVKEIDGEVLLKIYAVDEFEFDVKKIIKNELPQKTVVITEIGVLEMDLKEYTDANMLIVIELAPESKMANINTVYYSWDNNWNALLDKIGIRNKNKIKIDEIRKK